MTYYEGHRNINSRFHSTRSVVSSSSSAEESVKPETSSSNIGDLLDQANTDIERAIRNLELALESGLVDENIWQLLAYLYLGTGQKDNFSSLDRRHEKTFGAPILINSSQQKMQLDSDRVVFEMPQKIVCGSLPNIASVQEACASPKGAILDFPAYMVLILMDLRSSLNSFHNYPMIKQSLR